MSKRTIRLAAVSTVVLMPVLNAQVAVNGTGSVITNSNAATPGYSTYTYTLAKPAESKALVVGYYNDNTATVTGATFDGVAATRFAANGRTAVACYFLPNPAPASVVVRFNLNGAGAPAAGIFVYELARVDTTGGAASVDAGTGTTLVTTGADKFVVNFHGVNNSNGAGTVPAAASIIPASNAAVFDINGGIGGGALCRGYAASSGAAGSKTLGWTAGADGEVSLAFVQAGNPDADGDGLLDSWEIGQFGNVTAYTGTDDPDGDGFSNEAEETAGSNPNQKASVPGDVDGDSFADATELLYFGNLNQTPAGDFDGDYANNAAEVTAGTSPANAALWPDSDADGMCDAWELAHGLNAGVDNSAEDADSDGSTDRTEFQAGSDPRNATWKPGHAVLAHRWSFTGNLEDSVGGSHARIANNDPANAGLSSLQNATSYTLNGGTKATSDYVQLGSNLLSGLQSGGVKPVTIEVWARQDAIQNWSRIFNFGTDKGSNPVNNESLRMTWTQGTDLNTDQVAWEGQATAWGPGNAPYVLGAPYHIVMTVVPAVFTNGAIASGARVTWYSAPASNSQPGGHPLYAARGTFNTSSDLRALLDSACTLGRSYYGDNTASATYDEVRIWKGALSDSERKVFQLTGPDQIDRSDADQDGFPDAWETARFGNTTTATAGVDSDADGTTDDAEWTAESNPNAAASTPADSDKDGLADAWELQYFKNLLQNGTDDPDNDYCDNEMEETFATVPNNGKSSPDTDGDGIADGWEYLWFGDLATAQTTLNAAANTNQDGDFDTDAQEAVLGSDPTNRFSGRDTDGDQLPDYWENVYFQPLLGTNYLVFNGTNDPDNDTISNAAEFKAGTNPNDGSSFPDINQDGIADGFRLMTTDAFGVSSFNAGTNWENSLAPAAGSNYLVYQQTIRTPDTAGTNTVFAGNRLVIANGAIWLKGTDSTAGANYVLQNAIVRNAGVASSILTGTVDVKSPSELLADNGPIVVDALVSGTGALTLTGNAAVINPVRFNHAGNTWSGTLTLGAKASLVVNGTIQPASSSIYHIAPGATGVTNAISGTGTLTLAGTLDINLAGAVPSAGATWTLVSVANLTYDPAFTVSGSGFTATGAVPGERVWTSGDGNYQFSEVTGQLTFVGSMGYAGWAAAAGLTPGVNDGASDDPDRDATGNLLEYLLGGNPLAGGAELVKASTDGAQWVFRFERRDLAETDAILTLRWSSDLLTWNRVPIGATSSGPDAAGVSVTVTEDGGTTTESDLIEVRLPKANAVAGRLFGQLEGALKN